MLLGNLANIDAYNLFSIQFRTYRSSKTDCLLPLTLSQLLFKRVSLSATESFLTSADQNFCRCCLLSTGIAIRPILSSATIRVPNFKKLRSKMADITFSRVIIKLSVVSRQRTLSKVTNDNLMIFVTTMPQLDFLHSDVIFEDIFEW